MINERMKFLKRIKCIAGIIGVFWGTVVSGECQTAGNEENENESLESVVSQEVTRDEEEFRRMDAGRKVVKYSLFQVIQMALEKNLEIRTELLTPQISQQALLQEQGVFDPTLDFEYNRSENNSAQQIDPRIGLETESELYISDNYEMGLRGLFPLGTQWELGIDTQNRRGTFNQFVDQYDTFVGLTLTQPLLRGFGSRATMSNIRIAREEVKISEWDFRERVMDVVTEAINIYNDLYFAKKNLEVALKSRELAEQLLQDNMQRAEVGVMSPLDVTSARAEVALREEDVILAQRAIRDFENLLKQFVTDEVLGLLDQRVEIDAAPRLQPWVKDVREAVSKAFQIRPDYQKRLLQLEQQNIRVAYAKNQALPRLDLVGSFGLNGLDGTFGDSMQRIMEDKNTEWRAGIVFSIPIPNREGRGRLAVAQLRKAQALIDLQRLEQDVVVDVDNAMGAIQAARQRIEATKVSRLLAQERLDAEQEKLQEGATTTFVVLELQEDLATAEAAELRAVLDYNKSVVQLDRETGMTLERNGIVLE